MTAAYEDPPQSGNWVQTGQTAKDDSVVTITFATDMAPYGDPQVTVGDDAVTQCEKDEVLNEFTCTWPVGMKEGEVYESKPVTVRLFDEAGNMTTETLAMLTLDFAPPELAGTAFVERCDDYGPARVKQDELWVPSNAAIDCSYPYDSDCDGEDDGTSGKLRVSFAITETVDEVERMVFLGEDIDSGPALTIEPCASSDNYIMAAYTPTGQESEAGCVPIKAAVEDAAGNTATFQVACLRFDFEAPDSPADDPSLVRLYRNPWGSADTAGIPEMRVEGCPGLGFCPDDVSAAAEVEAFVRLYDTSSLSGDVECTTNLLAEGAGTDAGGFLVPFTGDQAVVCVSQVDRAGNEGPKEQTRQVRWIASLNNKVVGDASENPHVLYQALPFDGPRPTLGPETRAVDVQSLLANVMSADENSTVQSSEDGAWKRMGPSSVGPAGLAGHGHVYVESRGHVLLYGGHNTGTYNEELWAWDGWKWTRLCTSDECQANEPPPRKDHRMWYDPDADKVIVYGGLGVDGHAVSDMWEWDGAAWREVNQGGILPPARVDFQAAYDFERGVIAWTSRCTDDDCLVTAIPYHKKDFGAVYDPVRQETLIFGDGTGGNQMWTWDGEDWRIKCHQQPCAGTKPSGRDEPHMMWDEVNSKVLLFGGSGKRDTYAWNGTQWFMVHPGIGAGGLLYRVGSCATFDPLRQKVAVYGGAKSGISCNNVWELDVAGGTGWKVNSPNCSTEDCFPQPRSCTGCAFFPPEESMMIFGGQIVNVNNEPPPNLYGWDGTGWSTWCDDEECQADGPGGSSWTRLAYHEMHGALYQFGGLMNGLRQDGLWKWDGSGNWKELCPQGNCEELRPPGRYGHGFVYDSERQRLIAFLGSADADGGDDTWEWTSLGIVPSLIAAFDLAGTQTVTQTLSDPQEKVVLAYRPRVRATGIGYEDEDPLAGVRLFVSSFGTGPWVPLWEKAGEAAVDTAEQEGGLVVSRDWACSGVQAFEPPEDPDGTGSRDYCEESTLDTMLSATGRLYLLVSPRGGGAPTDHASIALDYVELTVDYFRTGCTATSEDDTACDDGDPDTSGDVCLSGVCTGTL